MTITLDDTFAAESTNGPYGDTETSTRCTSHYISANAGLILPADLPSIHAYLDTILEDVAVSKIPIFRSSIAKDQHNGLVGPAWILQSLSSLLDINLPTYDYWRLRDNVISLSVRLINLVVSQYSLGSQYYSRTSITHPKYTDNTMNHHLWFWTEAILLLRKMSTAGRIKEYELHQFCVDSFTSFINCQIHTSKDGIYRHHMTMYSRKEYLKRIVSPKYRKMMNWKEYSYHYFSHAAIARILSKSSITDPYYPMLNQLYYDGFGVQNKKDFWDAVFFSPYGVIYNPIFSELVTSVRCINEQRLESLVPRYYLKMKYLEILDSLTALASAKGQKHAYWNLTILKLRAISE